MKINIKTNKKLFFRQALEIVKHIPPYNSLRPRELDVLAQFLYYDNEFKDLAEDVRGKILFDYDTKQSMRDFIGINEAVFNTTVSTLKSKGFILGKTLSCPKHFENGLLKFDTDYPEITFKFKIEE
jgi:hypothetical protein